MDKYELLYTSTDADLSIYDRFRDPEDTKPTIAQIIEELHNTCEVISEQTIDTDAIHGLPRTYITFKCPIGTREKYESYGIFTRPYEVVRISEEVSRQQQALAKFYMRNSSCCGGCTLM